MEYGAYIGWTVFALVLVFLLYGIRIVRPTERAAIETLGRFSRMAGSGFNWIIPVIQRLIAVNITETLMDVRPSDMITKDNLNAKVDLVVYFKVKSDEESVKRALYSVNDYRRQIVSLAHTTGRNVIGSMAFKDVNSERNKLNARLAAIMKTETANWGVEIVRVEMMEINPPKDVQDTMNSVIKAENEKIAAKDFATARETEADGERRAAIKKAEGIKAGKVIVAEGQAKSIELVNNAANKYFRGNAKALKQLEVTQASLEKNSKVVLTEKGINPSIIMDAIPIHNTGGT